MTPVLGGGGVTVSPEGDVNVNKVGRGDAVL